MDRALRELYASMQELRQANDSPRSRQILERSRSLDDSIIPVSILRETFNASIYQWSKL